jgi:ABC-type multidrug transport system fused ATPase/permease subunit
VVSFLILANVSLGRIDEFLVEPETTKWDERKSAQASHVPTVGFVNATCSYTLAPPVVDHDSPFSSKDQPAFTLVDLNLEFPIGQLSLIIGPVGSGKSTVLLSLLRETYLLSGSSHLPSPIARADGTGDPAAGLVDATAYCSQAPWLLSDTIRANILFGHVMVRGSYLLLGARQPIPHAERRTLQQSPRGLRSFARHCCSACG